MSGEPESQRYFFSQISMLIDGMKGLNTQIGRQVKAMDRYDAEFAKLARSDLELRSELGELKVAIGQLGSDVSRFQLSTEFQLQGILKRLDALDGAVHETSGHVQELRSDGLRQYNEILNALQDSHQNRMSVNDIQDRLAELERLVASLRPPPAA